MGIERLFGLACLAIAGCVAGMAPALAQQSTPEISIVEKWIGSGHGDATSPSFTHWNAEGVIPQNCALCHSGAGFREFYGLDGSAGGAIAHPVPTGGVVDCATCHEDGAEDIAMVRFPSGAEIHNPGSVATCLTCHQGRQSGAGVARATADMDEDAVNPELSFINPHYGIAAAMLHGSEVRGAYEYPGRAYMGRFAHVPPFSQCIDCHDAHSLEVRVETCIGCHQTEDLRAIRTSAADFDGDGDTTSGIYHEIASLHAKLLDQIETYAREVAGVPVTYAARNPYFLGPDGARHAGWTPRLLRAAYNYQFIAMDKGAYSHNPHYALQVLHDSIESLAEPLGTDMGGLTRP